MSEVKLTFPAHERAFLTMASASKKDLKVLWIEEARRCFGGVGGKSGHPGVAGITPPYGAGGLQNTRTAQKHAEALVQSDIRSLYGTPGDAYEEIADVSQAQASAFWFLHSHSEEAEAGQIVKAVTGKSFSPFDGGKLHASMLAKNALKRRRSRKDRSAIFYVQNQDDLDRYIQQEQAHVWWLASGWAKPLQALKARLPAGVKKLPAPGHIHVVVNDEKISITIGNDVKFAANILDLERRIQTVMNEYRVERLERWWKGYLDRLNRRGKKRA